MDIDEKEKCNALIKAFAPYIEKYESYVADVGKYGYLILTAEFNDPDTSFAVGNPLKTYEEVKEGLVGEYTVDRVMEIICSLPSEKERERRSRVITEMNDVMMGVDEADREKIKAEIEHILLEVSEDT